MAWDRVHTVNDYYDGPRLGIADVDGVPHIYEAEFDYSTDEFGDTYFVSPVDENLMALVLEDWEIWLRWNSAFKRGNASAETHPACLKIARGMRLSKSPLGIACGSIGRTPNTSRATLNHHIMTAARLWSGTPTRPRLTFSNSLRCATEFDRYRDTADIG